MSCREAAPAKINLALHVTGQREDGYHLLETLVTFASHGDMIEISAADADDFSISGRFSSGLSRFADGTDGNLVLKARDALRRALESLGRKAAPVHIHLEKNLPVASGIGGGSADAAATIRALQRHWGVRLPQDKLDALAIGLGADVPMCLAGRPLMAAGVGEAVMPLPAMPGFAVIVANPLRPVSTPEVFRALETKCNPAIGPLPELGTEEAWIDWIATLRNDLEPPARLIEASIGELAALLRETGPRLVRMSGSGASCFALYKTKAEAEEALAKLTAERPDWFFMLSETVTGDEHHGWH